MANVALTSVSSHSNHQETDQFIVPNVFAHAVTVADQWAVAVAECVANARCTMSMLSVLNVELKLHSFHLCQPETDQSIVQVVMQLAEQHKHKKHTSFKTPPLWGSFIFKI